MDSGVHETNDMSPRHDHLLSAYANDSTTSQWQCKLSANEDPQ